MNVPALRFPEFSGEWREKRLGTVLTSVDAGWSPQCEERKASLGEWGVLKTTSVVWGGFDGTQNKALPNQLMPRPKLQATEGDILITRAGPISRVAVVAYVPEVRDKLMISDKLMRARTNSDTDPEFVSRLLGGSKIQNYFSARKSGLAEAQANISQSILQKTPVTVPSLPEQKKIAAFLGVVDAKIAALRDRRAGLDRYKRGLMQALFSQKIRFTKDDGSAFPDWENKKADKLFASVSSKKHQGDLPILAITQDGGAVLREEIDIDIKATAASVLSYKIVEPGDFIISLRSFQGGIEYSTVLGICSPAYTILKAQYPIADAFYKSYLKDADFISRLSATVVGIRDGKQISYSAFSTLILPYPHPDEQQKIADALSAVDAKITAVADQITKMPP